MFQNYIVDFASEGVEQGKLLCKYVSKIVSELIGFGHACEDQF
jgi:hypothetical protein